MWKKVPLWALSPLAIFSLLSLLLQSFWFHWKRTVSVVVSRSWFPSDYLAPRWAKCIYIIALFMFSIPLSLSLHWESLPTEVCLVVFCAFTAYIKIKVLRIQRCISQGLGYGKAYGPLSRPCLTEICLSPLSRRTAFLCSHLLLNSANLSPS